MPVIEQARLDHQQKLENHKKSQQAYENWKAQKDLEQELAQLASSDSSLEPKSN